MRFNRRILHKICFHLNSQDFTSLTSNLVTLHNIATIDAARGNHQHALALYKQVIALQRKLFGPNHIAVAVTCACMGDVFERVGDINESIACFEESVRIKTIAMGRHSLEVARLLHKLSKLAILQGDHALADSYVSRAILIYRLNKLSESDEWMVDATRDAADIDAALVIRNAAHAKGTLNQYYNYSQPEFFKGRGNF